MTLWRQLARWIEEDGRAVLVRIADHEGSSPREMGASLIVRTDGRFSGTIGGGALEHAVLARARSMLAAAPAGEVTRHVLGPALGQCCGGTVDVRIEVFALADLDWIEPLAAAGDGLMTTLGEADTEGRIIRRIRRPDQPDRGLVETFGTPLTPVYICGAGHIGRALVMALAPLPFAVTWIDPRPDMFPAHVPAGLRLVADDPLTVIDEAPPGTLLVVLTHSHPLDLALVSRALPDPRFRYVGLIGSATKRARFMSRMRAAGLDETARDRLVCPIGGQRVRDKHPAVIAAMVTAELLERREQTGASIPAGMPRDPC